MTTVDSWPVEIALHEDDGTTRAEARLARDGVGMTGHGCRGSHVPGPHMRGSWPEERNPRETAPELAVLCRLWGATSP